MADLVMKDFPENQQIEECPKPDKCQIWKEKVIFFIQNITIEPLVIFCAIAGSMTGVVIQALVSEQTCLVKLGYSQEYCTNVSNTSVKQELKGIMADFNMYSLIIESGPYVFLTLFAGSWCDQHSPKGLILVNMVACILSGMVLTIVSYVKYVMPEMTLIGHAIRGLAGSHNLFNLGIYNYVTVNSSEKALTTRLTFIDASFVLGTTIGYQLGSWVFGSNKNYSLVFLVSVCIYLVTIPYVLYTFRNLRVIVGPTSKALRGMFKLHHLKNGLQVLSKKRLGRKRLHIILTMICINLLIFPGSGDWTIFFPYAQLALKFTVKIASYYDSYLFGVVLIGTLIVLPILSYVMGVNDIFLGIIAIIMIVLCKILTGLSTTPLMMFLSATLLIIAPAGHIVCRSIMSKCVSKDEQGKLISVFGLLSAGIPILSSFTYDKIFHATMATYPATCFFVSAGIFTLPAFGFIWIYYDIKRHPVPETELQDEDVLIQDDSGVELN